MYNERSSTRRSSLQYTERNQYNLYDDDEEEDSMGVGGGGRLPKPKTPEMEEEELLERLNNITEYIKKSEDVDESNLEILFTFFKEYLKDIGDNFTCPIYMAVKKAGKGLRGTSLSSNNVKNFDMKDFLSTVAKQKKQNTPESIRQLILQNVQIEEEIIKIMVISNGQSTKGELLASLFSDSGALEQPEG
jgi:hypothetical protein